MKASNLILSLIALAAGISVGYIAAPKRNTGYEDQLRLEALRAKDQAADALVKMHQSIVQAREWEALTKKYQDSAAIERKQKLYYKNIYANISHVPTPKYSEPELDSLIGAIIR